MFICQYINVAYSYFTVCGHNLFPCTRSTLRVVLLPAYMDEKGGLGIRNWDFSEQSVGVDAVLKPVSGVPVPSGTSGHQAAFLKMGAYANRNSMVPQADTGASTMEYGGHCWVHPRNFLPPNKANPSLQATPLNTETGLPVVPTGLGVPTDGHNNEFGSKSTKIRKQQPSAKKANRVASKALRPKQPKKKPSVSTTTKKKNNSMSTAKHEKKNLDIVIGGATLDFSRIPAPICSCTGVARQCYRWGAGGWQSSCCTTNISEYPLPMSSKRPGARMAGRKMSNGAYAKLLQRLAAEGHDLSHPVDLKDHWARHGTNKFVTIK
uniref:GAGA-binding transcriptional activator n=1 Tax=Nelumbo nucifera TaxID=4432 RepID=A0A822XJA5_NELNU|nr:TPA_asm: hypothetical protein HUJ06_020694 [Nelumbo nucifera]